MSRAAAHVGIDQREGIGADRARHANSGAFQKSPDNQGLRATPSCVNRYGAFIFQFFVHEAILTVEDVRRSNVSTGFGSGERAIARAVARVHTRFRGYSSRVQ